MLFHTLAEPTFLAPFQTLQSLQAELERFMTEPTSESSTPLALALYTRDDALLVRASLPGVEAKEISLEIDGDLLTLSGRFPEEPQGVEILSRHLERPRGKFTRALRLPFEVDAARVEARLERGVLEVRIPRLAKNPPVKIPVVTEARSH